MNNPLFPRLSPPAAPGTGVPSFLSEEACRTVIAQMRAFGVGSRVDLISQWRGDVRWARNRIAVASDWRTNTVGLQMGGHSGNVSLNQVDPPSLRGAADRLREVDTHRSPSGRSLVAWSEAEAYPATHVWSDATYAQTPEARSTLVATVTTTVEQAGMLSAGYLCVEARGTAYGFMNGEILYTPQTITQCSLTVRDPAGTGSGWAGASSYDWTRIDVAHLAAIALDKCLQSRNPVKLEPGRYTTILEPQATFELIRQVLVDNGTFGISLETNENVASDRMRFPFTDPPKVLSYPGYPDPSDGVAYGKTMLGQKLFDARIQIRSDPGDPQLGTLPYSKDGDPYVPVTWIKDGVLTTLATDGRYAAVAKRERPQPWSGAFQMEGSAPPVTVEEMIATTKRGLLVTRFWDVEVIGVKNVMCTGMTRDGLWLIENGKISHPVCNFRFTESPMFAFNQVEQIGTPVPVFNPECPAVVPPIKVRDFSFTALIDAV